MKPVYLLTGATGFVGHALLAHLAESPAPRPEIVILVRNRRAWQASPLSGTLADAGICVSLLEGELDQTAQLAQQAVRLGVTGIFHLAAIVRHSRQGCAPMMQANVEGTRQMALLAHQIGARLVFLSTSGTTACSKQPTAGADELAPTCDDVVGRWPYYASKLAAERAARAVLTTPGALVIARPPVILGPGDHRFRSSGNVIRFLRGKLPFSLPGRIAFTDVRDVSAALAAMMTTPEPRPAYHLPGHVLSLTEFFELLAKIAHRPAPRWILPWGAAKAAAHLARALERLLPGSDAHLFVDPIVVEMARHHWDLTSRYAHELGYAPRPAEQTLQDTVRWLRTHRDDCGP